MDSYTVRINGFTRSVEASDPDKPLLYVLRGLGLPIPISRYCTCCAASG